MSKTPRLHNEHEIAIQSAAADVDHSTAIRELRDEVGLLSQLVGLLLDANTHGSTLDPEAEPLRALLVARAEMGTTEGTGIIVGKVTCHECGAAVNDVLGATAETCVFCGATVSTDR